MMEPVISARGLSKLYPLGKNSSGSLHVFRDLIRPLYARSRIVTPAEAPPEGMFWALKDINFEIAAGERLGIIGRNGAGKSTLLKILSRVTHPTAGEALIHGRVTSLLEVGTGFSENVSGRDNIFLNATLHGLTRAEVNAKLDDIIEFSELRRFIEMPLGHYSTGMRARLAFSIAAHLDPDILILDEVLAVGDLAFQQKCLERMKEITGASRTLLFVSHSLSAVRQFCSRAIWLERGRIIFDGSVDEAIADYSRDSLQLIGNRSWESDSSASPPAPAAVEANAPQGDLPNDEPAGRLISASIITDASRDVVTVTADETIVVEAVYDVFRDHVRVLPGFRFYNENGVLIFTAVYSSEDLQPFDQGAGRYTAHVEVPPHFFNIGRITVSIGLNTPISGALERHHVVEEALAFVVHEVPYPGRNAKGPYPEVKGAVRPIFKWDVKRSGEAVDEPDSQTGTNSNREAPISQQ